MARHIIEFLGGFSIGLVWVWKCDDLLYAKIAPFTGIPSKITEDYLKTPLHLSLEERRSEFKRLLKEKGASFQLVKLIGDANRRVYDIEAQIGKREIDLESEILGQKFQECYPELFDNENGKEFIRSLDLKTKCNDSGIPLIIKPN